MIKDEKWMQIALLEAQTAKEIGEIPVGAILVHNNRLIAKSHNQSISKNDPTAHAEIIVLRKAGNLEKNYRLIGSTLYVTLEPCAMCFGAMMHARIERVVFGAIDPKTGVCGTCIDLTKEKIFNHKILITKGILGNNCKKILQDFFKEKRQHKHKE
jgi:tRNA(adenine34) deaminase